MTNKEKTLLLSVFRMLYMDANKKTCRDLKTGRIISDEIVLVVDGVETRNTYPIWCVSEPDCKSPKQWIDGIALESELKHETHNFTLKLKRA
jgi:hypothetical protein